MVPSVPQLATVLEMTIGRLATVQVILIAHLESDKMMAIEALVVPVIGDEALLDDEV